MYCPCSTAAIVTDTGQWYRCTADITAPLSHAVLQEDGGQWVVGRILEGAALEDKTSVPADVPGDDTIQW